MSENDTFRMTYSAEDSDEIKRIRDKYTEKKADGLERLKNLDRKCESTAAAVSVTAGIIGTLIFGTGLSIYLSELGSVFGNYAPAVSITVGLSGIFIMVAAYPLYTCILKRQREKHKKEILALADELLKQK